MRKIFAATGIAAAIAGGSVAGLAVASGASTTSDESTQNTVLIQDGAQDPGARHGGPGRALDAASEIIGIERDSLRDALRGGQTLAEVAEENGVSQDELVSQLTDRANERIDQAVQDGRLTQAEADEKRATLSEDIQERVTSDAPLQRGERGGRSLETAARVIGVDETTVRAELRSGQSLAEIAQDNGVEPASVVDAIADEKTERIQQAVADDRLTQAEADEKLAQLEDRVEARVNGERPAPGGAFAPTP